jgi:hypothetical protein
MGVSSRQTDGNYTFENDGVIFRIEVMGKFVWGRGWLMCLYRTNLVMKYD